MSLIFATQLTAIATAALAVFAIVTAIYAVRAFRKQSQEVRDQAEGLKIQSSRLELQERQFEEQRTINRKRDELLDKQLEEFGKRAQAIERLQADDVDLLPTAFRAADPSTKPSGVRILYMAEVTNRSPRPIRDAACRIEPEPGGVLQAADTIGRFTEITVAAGGKSRMLMDRSDGSRVELIRAGETAGFIFDLRAKEHPKARMTVRFTDDAGLHWQIDQDLHLEQLSSRDW